MLITCIGLFTGSLELRKNDTFMLFILYKYVAIP